MLSKILQKISEILNVILVVNLIVIGVGFGYWVSIAVLAKENTENVSDLNTASLSSSNPKSEFKLDSKASPNIGLGVSEKLSSNLKLNKSSFQDTGCSDQKSGIKPNSVQNLPGKKIVVPADLHFPENKLFKISKDSLVLKAAYKNTLIYGQDSLTPELIDYIECVMDLTANYTAVKLQLNIDTKDQNFFENPTRLVIFDDYQDFASAYKNSYGDSLGNIVPLGLSENGTISTFLTKNQTQTDLKSNLATNSEHFEDIRYRLTYNIAHEYFHNLFSVFRPNYTPFIEEGFAVFIAGKVTGQIFGYKMDCTYRLEKAKLVQNQLLDSEFDLQNFDITVTTKDWYKFNNTSELYGIGYYFIQDLDSRQSLPTFTKNFLTNPSFKYSNMAKLPIGFKETLKKLVEADKYDCGYIEK